MIHVTISSDRHCERRKSEKKYKSWDLLENIPFGWSIDKSAGSPVCGYVFITNGKSPLKGQERALLRMDKKRNPFQSDSLSSNFDVELHKEIAKDEVNSQKERDKVVDKDFTFIESQAKTVNNLARQRFKVKLLNDILVDLTICEIEGWSKKEYIEELKALINGVGG